MTVAETIIEVVDLVIIGGGPTGLLSACLARKFGLSVAVLDKKDGPLEVGRADALNARTQQYLEVAGLLDELLPRGIRCNTSTTFADGKFQSRQSHWWTSLKHTFYNNFLMVGQPVVESVISAHLDIPVRYGEPILSFAEDADGVLVRSAKREIRAKYCIAADGARSSVRTALDIPFQGTKPNMTWAVLDTFIEIDFPTCSEIITFQLNGESRVSWIPRERGMARFYVLLPGEITQEKTEESIRQHMAPHNIDFVETEWFSKFEIKERIASTFISQSGKGRIVLAGDAAHGHSVNGGQGLNTGLADAFSLVWRLAHILNFPELPASLKEDLLTSYELERRLVAQEVIDVAAKLVRKTVEEAKDYVKVIEKNAGYITGTGVSYAGLHSPLIHESNLGIFKAGDRCPDVWLTSKLDPRSRLYSIVPCGRYVLILAGSDDLVGDPLPKYVTTLRVLPLRAAGRVGQETGRGRWHAAWARTGESYAVLVRPDMYVEAVGAVDDMVVYANRRFLKDFDTVSINGRHSNGVPGA